MKLEILALDVATITGWATKTASGTWDLRPKRDESKGMRLIRLRAKLTEICEIENVDLVVFERTSGFHKNAIIVQSEMHGVMKATLEELGIDYRAYSAAEIKKHATGKGNAKKDQMVKAAEEKWPELEIIDDNHADARWLLDLACTDLSQ
jgi:Holliday junction resolvasome RuvABC endonuclease subunit